LAASLIPTKMSVPRTRQALVARPRLEELLEQSLHARLTLVSGPAGFGKSTLVAAWLSKVMQEGKAVAWVSLDAADDDPERFWRYVVAALEGACPGTIPDADELSKATGVSPDRVVAALVNDLATAATDVWLVLDDYHTVQSGVVHDGVEFLLANVSPRTHVVIITRADPDLPLPRWRVRRELVEVRVADLRFTLEETHSFLNGISGLNLSGRDVKTLEQRTEGWVAALQLAALSLQGRDRNEPGDFISRFAGNDKYIVDYLVDEVLAHLEGDIREFLLSTSILDRISGSLCDAVTGRDHGRLMLANLERANLFLFPLDDQRAWYRYHHLFVDVLRARLYQEHGEAVSLLHRNASRWFEDNGDVEDAVRHALDGKDYARATYLMELALPAVRRNRQDALLMRWLIALPDKAVAHSPALSVFYGWMLMVTGDLGAVEARLDDATRTLANAPAEVRASWAETDELRSLPATIAVYRASLAQARGQMDDTASHAQHAVDLSGPDDHLARGAATGFLGLASWAHGDVTAAVHMFGNAVDSLLAAGNLVDSLGSTVVLADMFLAAGRPGEARRLYTRALRSTEAQGLSFAQTSALLHVGLSEIDLEVGDLTRARWHLDTALTLDDHLSLTANHFRWFLAMGRLTEAEGDRAAAVELLERAQSLYRPGFFVDVRPIPAVMARVWIGNDQLHDAERWAAGYEWSTTDASDYLAEYDHLTYVRLLLAQHRAHTNPGGADEAARLLEQMLGSAISDGRWGSVIEIHMLAALVHDAQGDRSTAVDSLSRAFTTTPEPGAYARLFLAEGEPMLTLLRYAQHLGLADGHPARILTQYERPVPNHALVDPLSERETQVLRLLDSDLTGPEIARSLFVSHNTVRTHTRHIFAKLQVTTRRAAVLRAAELRLL
jgi:LuxR family transcriptional regulator, maltose regulon positive regulatory protein